jgi:hypothetical protein
MWQSLWQNRKRPPYKPALANYRLSSVAIVQRNLVGPQIFSLKLAYAKVDAPNKKARRSGPIREISGFL